MATINHWYLHVDLDAFFASVEQLDHPEYRGKPVIVGGKPEDRRSVVSTASYEARKYGVHSAMPTFQAYKLCPQGIYVHGRMERYAELSYQIMSIFKNYSPDVDQMSIDEAFIDITGTEKLFGPPLETAKKIKAEVKQNTGLTVSVGIAPTKYLAKIASGFQKPDGITFIDQGQEESFMLDLPLNKVWGLGPKSLELIRSKGIKTTRDIYELPLENLQFMFGNNMGSYLFEVVRGNEKATFTREAKNHSISAESTFPYDLTDLYTIETELLELSHGVFFRLLKENGFSRTAFVKIRYEDFTTCSVQETFDRNIMTLDSYFEIIKKLFEKRYEKGRGIRLLGVGFDNIENEEKPYQQDLFGNNDEKKQAVEKAILKLEKKHPEIKVRKARTLKAILLFGLLALFPKKTYAQETSLFEYEIEGYYNADFLAGVNFDLTNSFKANLQNPVFKQEVDISFTAFYNNRWYFNVDFADEFETNTYTFGYKSNGLNAKVSNRNILFPAGYSAEFFGYSPKGGNNQAPGFSFNFESPSKKWAADFLLRYDMTKTNSATFYGLNKVTETYISPENFLYGHSFTFPETSSMYFESIEGIYIQDTLGTYKDSHGFLYKKLSITEYTFIKDTNTLLISTSSGGNIKNNIIPRILVTFTNNAAADSIIISTGEYSNDISLAGKIQKSFGTKYSLSDYSYSLKEEIDNNNALLIQNSQGFSPYLNKNIYDCGIQNDLEISVVSRSSGLPDKNYKIVEYNDIYNSLNEDFFQENHKYIQVLNTGSVQNTAPFSIESPELYLNLETGTDTSLLARKYTSVKELFIGTKASAGSITVYKNNQMETGAIYNAETGIITLISSISSTDKIYITWQEDSSNFSNGTITSAAGFKINFSDVLSGDVALTSQWPVYSDEPQTGYAALSGGITYKTESLTLAEKTNVSLTKENVANNLLVCTQENNISSTKYLSSDSGFPTKTAPYINTLERTVFLQAENNHTTGSHKGISDSEISGYSIPLSWKFTDNSEEWASIDIKLNYGTLLKNAEYVEFGLKSDIQENDFNNYDFYIQLGINASEDFNGEDTTSLVTKKIDLKNERGKWQKVNINLSKEERTKLISYNDIRLIVMPSYGKTTNTSGTIYAGPYEPHIKSIYTVSPDNINVYSTSSLYKDDYYSSYIKWSVPSGTDINGLSDPYIYAWNHFESKAFTSYKYVLFDFKTTESAGFTFQLKNKEKIAIELILSSINSFADDKYHTLKISTETHEVFIDDRKLPSDSYILSIDSNTVPDTEELIIPVKQDGSFNIGNLIYEETDIIVSAKNYASASYNKDFNGIKVKANIDSTQSTGAFSNPQFGIVTNAKAGISTKYLSLEADIKENNEYFTDMGHAIKAVTPGLSIVQASEEYRFHMDDKTLSKKDSVSLDFVAIKIPVKFDFQTTAQDASVYQNQQINANGNTSFNIGNVNTSISVNANASQKINTLINTDEGFEKNNYFTGWKDITTAQFSRGSSNALNRQNIYAGTLSSSIPYGNLKPVLTYSLTGQFNEGTVDAFTDKEQLALSVPFTVSSSSFAVNISRAGSGITNSINNQDYFDDSEKLFNVQNERSWFYSSIPFYELFNTNIADSINGNYSMKYEAVYKRALFNSIQDLYIPSGISFTVTRDIKNNSSEKDIYQYKAVISNQSVNNLGADSLTRLFTWFKQEELLTNLSAIVKVPADSYENISYQISGDIQALLFISDNATLTTTLYGVFETNMNWSSLGTVIYSRPSEVSFIKSFAQFLIPYLNTIDFQITRKDSLNIQIERNNKILKQAYTYNHNVDHKFMEHYSVTTGIGATYSSVENSSNTLDINIKLGFKAEF